MQPPKIVTIKNVDSADVEKVSSDYRQIGAEIRAIPQDDNGKYTLEIRIASSAKYLASGNAVLPPAFR